MTDDTINDTTNELSLDAYASEIIQNLQAHNLALDDEATLIREYLTA